MLLHLDRTLSFLSPSQANAQTLLLQPDLGLLHGFLPRSRLVHLGDYTSLWLNKSHVDLSANGKMRDNLINRESRSCKSSAVADPSSQHGTTPDKDTKHDCPVSIDLLSQSMQIWLRYCSAILFSMEVVEGHGKSVPRSSLCVLMWAD